MLDKILLLKSLSFGLQATFGYPKLEYMVMTRPMNLSPCKELTNIRVKLQSTSHHVVPHKFHLKDTRFYTSSHAGPRLYAYTRVITL